MKLDERFQAYHGELVCPDSSQVHDALTGDVVADFPSPREPRDGPLARRQAARAEHLASTLNAAPRIRVGMTVRVKQPHGVERYPHFWITEGTGVVVEISEKWGNVWVHMDAPVEGCEEWDNEIQISDDFLVNENGEHPSLREAFDIEFEATGYAEYTYGSESHVDGVCDLASLLSQEGLTQDERTALRTMTVGSKVTFGGGAMAVSVIERIA
jgi:hypothetical protein